MNLLFVGRLLPLTLLVAGCAHKRISAPAEQKLELGSAKATWRDYSKVNACGVDPKVLSADLDSMNALVATFLDRTSAGTEGVWADEHLEMLSAGLTALPTPLDGMESELRGIRKCGFSDRTGLPDGQKRGFELAKLARTRLADGPHLLAVATAKRELEKWKQAHPEAEAGAKADTCGPKRKTKPGPLTIYYGFEDEKGRTEWLFCSGHRVVAVPGSKPELVPDPKAKKGDLKGYVEAAIRYPPAQVRRAPKVPPKTTAKPEGKNIPEPKDDLGSRSDRRGDVLG